MIRGTGASRWGFLLGIPNVGLKRRTRHRAASLEAEAQFFRNTKVASSLCRPGSEEADVEAVSCPGHHLNLYTLLGLLKCPLPRRFHRSSNPDLSTNTTACSHPVPLIFSGVPVV